MPGMSAHEKPSSRRDHLLPALALIVGSGLLEVWASWLTIASVSGFPKLGRMTTGWILPVTAEAYWTVALFAWLVSPAGPRSRKFAMWTAALMFALSLTGQEAGHLLAAEHRSANVFVVAFVGPLPLIAIALGAILIHLRHLDREEAEQAAREAEQAERRAAVERAEADERALLRAEIGTLTERLATAEAERDDAARQAGRLAMIEDQLRAERTARETDKAAFTAELEAAQAARGEALSAREDAERETASIRAEAEAMAAKVEKLTRKLDGASGEKRTRNQAPKRAGSSTQKPRGASTPEVEVPEDIDTQAAALEILAREPGISGSELGRRLGKTERYGCMLKKSLATASTEGGGDT